MIKAIGPVIILLATIGLAPIRIQPRDLVTVVAPQTHLRDGETTEVPISIVVKEGYHIQANVVDDKSLIPTSLVVEPSDNIIVVRTEFPRAKEFKLEGTDTFLKVFDGEFSAKLFLAPTSGAPPGEYNLTVNLHYQACDSRTCFFPKVVNFAIPVRIMN